MFVLGIDPGLTTTGYGVVEVVAGGERAVAAGTVRTDRSRSTALRLIELHKDLVQLIREYRPDAAAVEQVFVNRNVSTAVNVARASGVILHALATEGLEPAEYTPSGVKMTITGNGSAPKEQIQRVVAMRLGLPGLPQPADAADALAIALCHCQHLPAIRAGVVT